MKVFIIQLALWLLFIRGIKLMTIAEPETLDWQLGSFCLAFWHCWLFTTLYYKGKER